MSQISGSPIQSRPGAISRSSIDLSYSCVDLTAELEEAVTSALGGGSFSNIYKYKDQHADPPVYYAVKEFRYHTSFKLSEKQTERRIKREIRSWASLRHSNVLRLEGILYRPDSQFPCLVSLWMQKGTAKRHCEDANEIQLINFVSGISDGLSYMHQKGITHGDIRGDNILVSDSGQALICDFGLSKIIENLTAGQVASSTVGHTAYRYRAPEFYALDDVQEKPTLPGDVWMFGMTFLELWSGQIPFLGKGDPEVMMMLSKCELPDFSNIDAKRLNFKACKERVHSVCTLCWVIDPTNRPSMVTIAALMRLLASEERADGSLSSPTEADQVVDGGLEQPDSISNLSISDSPLLMPRTSTFVANGGNNGSPTSTQLDDALSSHPSSPSPFGSSYSSSSIATLNSPLIRPKSLLSWLNIPKPPSPSVNAMLQEDSTVFKGVLNVYKTKKPAVVKYNASQVGPDNSTIWKVTCTIGPEELGTGSSHQKKIAEEQSARDAVQKLKSRDFTMIAQCLQFLPVMRNHLTQHGLLDRVQFIDCPPNGPPHNRSFTCEVRKDGVKVCEGIASTKGDAQEQAARNFAVAWREGSL